MEVRWNERYKDVRKKTDRCSGRMGNAMGGMSSQGGRG